MQSTDLCILKARSDSMAILSCSQTELVKLLGYNSYDLFIFMAPEKSEYPSRRVPTWVNVNKKSNLYLISTFSINYC